MILASALFGRERSRVRYGTAGITCNSRSCLSTAVDLGMLTDLW
jgi:hypothetical protein